MKIKKQIKFGVVMYGGGSLAIYINGVSQELLKMSQATTGAQPNLEISGTSIIYRKIALLLSGNRESYNRIVHLQSQLKNAEPSKAGSIKIQLQDELRTGVDVEFIIDVLTGSSAGGINSIFLAKALVNGAGSMDDLQKLWLDQGDFSKLLNDRNSVADNKLNSPHQPTSLLNSQRMYLELLKALNGLDDERTPHPYTQRSQPIDLYVTYTDFEGLPTNITLSDKTVLERVHKRVFKFRYGETANDFDIDKNPFLAFAARCTSSFPIAFEPMSLIGIDEVIDKEFPMQSEGKSGNPRWQQYFSDLTDEDGKPVDWARRWFVDGGCLDNKPFGYAIDKLTQSTGEGIIQRKLLYIEPNPESFRYSQNKGAKPDALENVLGQAAGLPSYETIREDLKRVLERNRLIERVNRITAEVEGDFDRNSEWLDPLRQSNDVNWSKADLDDVAREKGPAFIPYYRLRVSSTTDEIARLVTRYFKIDDDSDYFNVLRSLIRMWREGNYNEYRKSDEDSNTFNRFLYQYDVEYRLRRLRFVLQKAEYMLRCKDEISSLLSHKLSQQVAVTKSTVVENKQGVLSPEAALVEAARTVSKEEESDFSESFSSENYVKSVLQMQARLTSIYTQLRRETESLSENLGSDSKSVSTSKRSARLADLTSFQSQLKEVGIELERLELRQLELERGTNKEPKRPSSLPANPNLPPALKALGRFLTISNQLKQDQCGDNESLNATRILRKAYGDQANLEPLYNSLKAAAETLDRDVLNKPDSFLRRASSEARALLQIETPRNQFDEVLSEENSYDYSTSEAKLVRSYLKNYYELFDSYDQISYPLFFESSVGEAVNVEVVRISSRDAQTLINEEDPLEKRRKLAGDYLFAFGAFLDPRWRLNDIMWGRLDGAERLITTLLPGEQFATERASLISEANEFILDEILLKSATDSFHGTVVDALTIASTEAQEKKAVDRLVYSLTSPVIRTNLTNALIAGMDPRSISEHVERNYEVNRRLEPKPTLEIISRSTQIIGKILEGIAEEKAQAGERLSWIAKLGRVFWGLVTVAAPNSFWNLLFNYWIQMLYVFEVIVILGSTILSKPEVQQVGVVALIITLSLHLIVLSLQDLMLGNDIWKKMLRFLIGGVLSIFVISGALFFYSVFVDARLWEWISYLRDIASLPAFERWRIIVPLVPFAFLFGLLAIWREVEKQNMLVVGRAIIVGVLLLSSLSICFHSLSAMGLGHTSMIDMQFADKGDKLQNLVGNLVQPVEKMRTAVIYDSIAFVPIYWGVLLLLAAMLRRRTIKWANGAAAAVVVFASLAACADLAENHYTLVAIDINNGPFDQVAGNIWIASHLKWTSIFVAFAITPLIFLRTRLLSIWNGIGVVLLLTSITGLIGVYIYPFAIWSTPIIIFALAIELIIWLGIAISFQFQNFRQKFLSSY